MKLFVEGRKKVFSILKKNISKNDRVIWLHAASLGEYEQGVPILEQLKTDYPNHKILVTFFSPSGYEVKKNNSLAHLTTYLPIDTKANAQKFIKLVHPELSLFVKYEVWPNYLKELQRHHLPALLISGNFRTDQIYFKFYGKFMKKALTRFNWLFVQNETSKNLLLKEKFKNVSISGDTRFDRVSQQLQYNNHLGFMEEFKGERLCVICGSTWPEDIQLLLESINSMQDIKFVIAPHEIDSQKIKQLQQQILHSSVLYSEKDDENLADYPVLIIDTVGLLSKVYAYADIAYVGGAAGTTGLHNILEPATFGLPILIGKNHHKFPEAQELKEQEGLFVADTPSACKKLLHRLIKDQIYRESSGDHSLQFIKKNQGATTIITTYITKNKLL